MSKPLHYVTIEGGCFNTLFDREGQALPDPYVIDFDNFDVASPEERVAFIAEIEGYLGADHSLVQSIKEEYA